MRHHADIDMTDTLDLRLPVALGEIEGLKAQLEAAFEREQATLRETVVVQGRLCDEWPRLARICRWLHRQKNGAGPATAALAEWVLGRKRT